TVPPTGVNERWTSGSCFSSVAASYKLAATVSTYVLPQGHISGEKRSAQNAILAGRFTRRPCGRYTRRCTSLFYAVGGRAATAGIPLAYLFSGSEHRKNRQRFTFWVNPLSGRWSLLNKQPERRFCPSVHRKAPRVVRRGLLPSVTTQRSGECPEQ